jgi:uncharacterized protein YoxC
VTRLAALHARITGDSSGFVTAAQQAENAAQDAAAAMGAAQAAGGRAGLAGAVGAARGAMAKLSSSPGMRMLPIQLSQVAQQAAAGGGVMRALSIQAADIGLAFGTMGAIVGTLATVAMPLVINAFSDGADEADKFKESLDLLRETQETLQGTLDILNMGIDELIEKYGAAAETVRGFAIDLANLQYQQAVSQVNEFAVAVEDVGQAFINMTQDMRNTAAIRTLRTELGLTNAEIEQVRNALIALQDAEGIDAQIAASQELSRVMEEVGIEAEDLDGSLADIQVALLQAGIAGAELERVMAAVRDRAAEAANASAGILGMTRGDTGALSGLSGGALLPPMSDTPEATDTVGGARRGGGGGRREETFEDKLEQLREELEAETETIRQAHDDRLEILRQAKEQELLTNEEYHSLMEAERKRFHDSLSGMDVYRYGEGLAVAEQFFGDMASAFASGNEEMMRISKIFAAGEALINAWRTYSQVMADPTLPWFAKVPAAVSLLGSAMQAVQAIQGAGKGGSGRRTASGAAGGAAGGQVEPTSGGASRPAVSLTLIGEQGFTRAQIVQIAEALNDSGDEGQQLVQVRGRR